MRVSDKLSMTEETVDFQSKKYKKSKLAKRCYAFYCDLILIGITQKLLVYTYIKAVEELLTTIPINIKYALVGNTFKLTLSTLTFTFFSYFMISLYINHGRTFGKAIFGLQVYSNEHESTSLTFMEVFLRTLSYTICYITGSFLFALAFITKNNRGIPDFLSSTEVITDEELEMKKQKQEIEHQYKDDQLELFVA